VSSDTKDAVRPISPEPFGFQDGAAEPCYAGPEGGLNCARVKAGASATDAAALKDVPWSRCIFMALGAPDAMAIQHPKPFRFEDAAPQFFYAGPKLSLTGKRTN
jgi:hypothetical protein